MDSFDYTRKLTETFQKQISESLKGIQLFTEQFYKQIEIAVEPIIRIQILSQEITNSLKPLTELINSDFAKWEDSLNRFGWIETISMSYVISGKEEVWKKSILDFKDSKVLAVGVQKIRSNPIISRRERILLRAIKHHRDGDYISSIPLLLTQIEGIFWDMGTKMKFIENKYNSKKLIDEKGNFLLDKYGKPIECSLGGLITKLFDSTSKFGKYAKNEVYTKDFRHPILHGREINYDNEQRSAMLLLMLYVLLNKNN